MEKYSMTKAQKESLLEALHNDLATEEELDGHVNPDLELENMTLREAVYLALYPENIVLSDDVETK